MPALEPSDRQMMGRIAAHESWARTPDRSARTAPARAALLATFEAQVDPEEKLAPAERARRAEHLRKAYFQRLALKSAQSRRKARVLAAAAETAEAELESLGGPDAA
jgi:hypothetical protein